MILREEIHGWLVINMMLVIAFFLTSSILHVTGNLQVIEATLSIHIDPAFAVRSVAGGSQ